LEHLEITRHDQLAKQQQLYLNIREIQDKLLREEEKFSAQSQELESLTTKRKTKIEEITTYIQRKSELLSNRDELMATEQQNLTISSDIKEKIGELNVYPPSLSHFHSPLENY
jgi:DNA repair exonuclease SbcCD ATPase subunit